MATTPSAHPSPIPVVTVLFVSGLLAALGIIAVAKSSVPALGWVFLAVGVVGVLFGVGLALKNVQLSRAVARKARSADDDADGDAAA